MRRFSWLVLFSRLRSGSCHYSTSCRLSDMSAPGIALAVGGITAANELFFAPVTGNGALKDFNWRIIPATAGFAILLAAIEKLSPTLANGIGVTALITALIVPVGKANSPLVNIDTLLGFGGK